MKKTNQPLANVDGYRAMNICAEARTSLREFRNLRSALAGERILPAQARLLLTCHRQGLLDLAEIASMTPKGG